MSTVQALSVGIFPYVLKLLQSSARELRPLLVFIWAKLLAVDSVRNDLTVSISAFLASYSLLTAANETLATVSCGVILSTTCLQMEKFYMSVVKF